jgi:hypothetical protein
MAAASFSREADLQLKKTINRRPNGTARVIVIVFAE